MIAIGMSLLGWTLLTHLPTALLLSQIPLLVWGCALLGRASEHVDWDWRPIRSYRAARPAPRLAEVADLPAPASLDEHRDRRAA